MAGGKEMTALIPCPVCHKNVPYNEILKHMSAHGDPAAKELIDVMNEMKETFNLKHFDVNDLVSDADIKQLEREAEMLKAGVVDDRDDFCQKLPLDQIQHIIINRTKRKVMLFFKPQGVMVIDFRRIRYIPVGQAAFIQDDPPP